MSQLEQALRSKFKKWRPSQGKHGKEYIVDCIFCRGKNKLYINPTADRFYCFRCGERGTVGRLLGHSRINVLNLAPPKPKPLGADGVIPPGTTIPLTKLDPEHHAIRYLEDRGFTAHSLFTRFGVQYCNSGQWFGAKKGMPGGIFNTTDTLIFPINMQGRLIGWQARLLYKL